jgi:RNA polymerase sigma-70 factor (ECF subfamily)
MDSSFERARSTRRENEGARRDDWILDCLPRLRIVARRLTASRADAADLVQATCLRALEKADQFVSGSPSDFRNWVLTIMYNLHHDEVRKRRRERLSAELDDIPSDGPGDAPDALAAEPAPVWRLVEDGSVQDAVRALPRNLQDPYVMFAVDRLTYSAIAARLKMPLRTVGTRIYRARARLRATLVGNRAGAPGRRSREAVAA